MKKMLKLREELLASQEYRIAGRNGCTFDEPDAYPIYGTGKQRSSGGKKERDYGRNAFIVPDAAAFSIF